MERIQSAIAKARAARQSQPAAPVAAPVESPVAAPVAATPVPAASIAAPPPPAETAIDAAWEALPRVSPQPKLLKRNRIVAGDGGRDAVQFDVMRTRALREMRANGWKRMVVTSPSANCGKSTVTLNLAMSLARQPEIRVIVIEMDFRRPSFTRLLGLRERHSTAEVLMGHARVEDNAVRLGRNLALVSMHHSVKNPSDLFQSPMIPEILAGLEETYAPTLLMFDMPPLLVSDDTLAFLPHTDCALLVAAAGNTTIKEIDLCERELAAHTSVMGVVLNKCRYMGRDYGAEYY